MVSRGITRRSVLAAALALPAIHRARADCASPTLRIRVSRDFETFDPADAYGDDAIITRNILAPLVRYRKRANDDELWTWEKHIVSSITKVDGKTYSFLLRGEGWLGGEELSANDVAYSFERVANSISAGNRFFWEKLEEVSINDSRSAYVRLKEEDQGLLTGTLPNVAGCVVNRSYVEGLSSRAFTLDPGPTSGRYELCSVSVGDRAILVRDDSWGGDPVEIESAAFIVIQDDGVAQSSWKAREIDVYRATRDVLYQLPEANLNEFGFEARPTTSRVAYLLQSQNGALQSPELRRAVQLAIDPFAVARFAYGAPEGPIATGLVPRGWPGWLSEPLYRRDPDEAARLASASRPAEPLQVLSRSDPILQRIAVRVVEDLGSVGIPAVIVNLPDNPPNVAALQGGVDIALVLSAPASFAPLNDFRLFADLSRVGLLTLSPEYGALFSTASSSAEPAAALQSMQRALIETGVMAPLVEDHNVWWFAPGLEPSFGPNGNLDDLGYWLDRR